MSRRAGRWPPLPPSGVRRRRLEPGAALALPVVGGSGGGAPPLPPQLEPMTEQVERVSLDGATVHVTARLPLPVAPRVLTLVAAARVFEQYAVLDRLVLAVADEEIAVSREEVVALLGPAGFDVLREPARYRQWLADVLSGPAPEAPR